MLGPRTGNKELTMLCCQGWGGGKPKGRPQSPPPPQGQEVFPKEVGRGQRLSAGAWTSGRCFGIRYGKQQPEPFMEVARTLDSEATWLQAD